MEKKLRDNKAAVQSITPMRMLTEYLCAVMKERAMLFEKH